MLVAQAYQSVLAWKGALASRHAEEQVARDQPALRPLVERLRMVKAGLARLAHTLPATQEHQAAPRGDSDMLERLRMMTAGVTGRAYTFPATMERQADWRRRFDELEAEKEKLETELARGSEAFRHFRELRQATAEQVSAALPPGAALVDFFQYRHATPPPERKGPFEYEDRLLAFVLVAGRAPALVFLGPAKPVEKAVESWRSPVQAIPPDKVDNNAVRELTRLVWQPLQAQLAGIRNVLIAPNGPLCALPFAALPGPKPGSYLIEEWSIGYVTSGRHILELVASERSASKGLLAVGDLHFGSPPDTPLAAPLPARLRKPTWRYLAGTGVEVERIAEVFRATFGGEAPPRLLTGEEGSVARLKRELTPAADMPRWRYLHLATHGYFESLTPETFQKARSPWEVYFTSLQVFRTYYRNPLLASGLVLAGANRSPDEGILTAEEIADLDLRGVELAFLSACETGLGRVEGGEGVLGLQRAFQAAEARTLVTSLWSVNDAATSVLVEEFYTNLWQKKLPKLEALRQAQLTVLRHPERVDKRRSELREVLVKRGLAEEELAQRGLGKVPVALPDAGRIAPNTPRRSPPAWWAAFVLSGDIR
jgi:CHAT domain-containing protein